MCYPVEIEVTGNYFYLTEVLSAGVEVQTPQQTAETENAIYYFLNDALCEKVCKRQNNLCKRIA